MKRNSGSSWGTPTPKRGKGLSQLPILRSGSSGRRTPRSGVSARSFRSSNSLRSRRSGRRRMIYRPKVKSVATGFYKGRVKVKQRVKSNETTKAMKRGYHLSSELFGQVVDPSCVYLGHSTYHVDLYVSAVMGALVRKVMQKAGLQVGNGNQTFEFEGVPTGLATYTGYTLRYYTINDVTGADTTVNFPILPLDSLDRIVTNFSGMRTSLSDYLTNSSNLNHPYRLELWVGDTGSVNDLTAAYQRHLAVLNLENEVMHMNIVSEMTVQNRSSGGAASGAAINELDRIDNQPLTGVIYDFKHGSPQLAFTKNNGGVGTNSFFNNMTGEGLKLIRSAQIMSGSSNIDYQEVPMAKSFANVSKMAKLNLDPGSIKRSVIFHKFVGKFTNIIKKMRVELLNSGFISGLPGKSQYVILQERLRTNSANPVTVTYQRNIKVGCYFITRGGPPPLITQFSTAEVNNVP